MATDKTQNIRIIIAVVLSLLHVVTLLYSLDGWLMTAVLLYYIMIGYGFISLARIILKGEIKLWYCLPFVIILVTFLITTFGPFPRVGFSIGINE